MLILWACISTDTFIFNLYSVTCLYFLGYVSTNEPTNVEIQFKNAGDVKDGRQMRKKMRFFKCTHSCNKCYWVPPDIRKGIGTEMAVRIWDIEEKEKGDSQSSPSRHIQFIHLFIHVFLIHWMLTVTLPGIQWWDKTNQKFLPWLSSYSSGIERQ